jgi:outer membrane protein
MRIRTYLQTIFSAFGLFFYTSELNFVSAQTLNDALRAGLLNSTELAAAREGWVAAREAVGSSSSTSDLSASFSSTGSYSRTDKKTGLGFTSTDTFSNAVTLSKNIYDGGQTRENTTLAEINLKSAGAEYRNTEQSVILATAKSYLTVLKARRDVELHSSNLERLGGHVKAASIRVAAGADTPTSLSEARAQFSRARSDTVLAETRLINAQDMFESLTKIKIGSAVATVQQSLNIEVAPKSVIDSEQMARTSHPTVLTAIGKERAAAQAFKTLEASVKPTLALSLSATAAEESDVLKASLTFSSQLFSTNASSASARRTVALHSQSKLSLRETIRSVEVAARSAYRDLKANSVSLEAVKSELEASRLVAKGISNEAEFGQKTTLDLLDAEKNVNDAELRLVSAEHDQLLAKFALQAAVGKLSSDQLALGDILDDLSKTPRPDNPLGNVFPFFLKDAEELGVNWDFD